MSIIGQDWFSEICNEGGTAFSFKLEKKLHEEQTPFQRIEIYATEKFGNLMVIDGFIMLSARDNFLYHEMMVHPALFIHAAPQRVLIVGGGDCGSLREVLKHPTIKSAHQVEIDERVTRLSETYFPELCGYNNDPRAEFHFTDGIEWVKNAAPGSYDIIIVDSTDPIGPAEGLFQEPFYRDCCTALDKDGILVQQSESPLYHMSLISDIHTAMRGAGYVDVHTLNFPQPVYPSGWWTATMARRDSLLNTFRENDARNKSFSTRYYNHQIHSASLATPNFMYDELPD